MLDNPYYLFSPLLNQFNVLYKIIKDNKRKPKLTVEDSAAEILVSYITNYRLDSFYRLCHYSVLMLIHVYMYMDIHIFP